MGKKTKNADGKGTAGGAAAAGGVGFQQRLAAYALAHAAVGLHDMSAVALGTDFRFGSMHLETSLEVDDVVLKGKGFRALIQAKRTVAISDSPKSAMSDAIGQFVRHHLTSREPGDRYVLATSLGSSGRVVFELRKLTESVRLNATALFDDPLTKAEEDVIEKTRKLIAHHINAERPGPVAQSEVDQVFASIWVLPLDIEAGGRDEATAINILRSRSIVDPSLIWKVLVDLAGTLAAQRGSIDLAGLQSRLAGLLKPADQEKTIEDEFRLEVVQMNELACGVEVLLFDRAFESDKLAIIEFGRFKEDGTRPLQFKGNLCVLNEGEGQPYLFRSSTMSGMERLFERQPDIGQGREIVLVPRPGKDNPNDSPWAIARRELVTQILRDRGNPLACIICGDAVSENRALVAEIDEEGLKLDVGFAHWRCHRPSLRVLGEIQSELFAEYAALKNFDYEAWIRALRYGPGMIFGMPLPAQVVPALWKPATAAKFGGAWCVQINTDDGSSFFATDRGRVSRLGDREIAARIQQMNEWIDSGRRKKNPMCTTADKGLNAPYSELSRMRPGERLLRWVSAEAAPFTKAIDATYSSRGSHYAPAVLLVALKDDAPVVFKNDIFSNAIFMVSDPFRLAAQVENWQSAGIEMPEYRLHIVTDDQAFDSVVLRSQEDGLQIVIDPVFDLEGHLVRGILVQVLEEFLEERHEAAKQSAK